MATSGLAWPKGKGPAPPVRVVPPPPGVSVPPPPEAYRQAEEAAQAPQMPQDSQAGMSWHKGGPPTAGAPAGLPNGSSTGSPMVGQKRKLPEGLGTLPTPGAPQMAGGAMPMPAANAAGAMPPPPPPPQDAGPSWYPANPYLSQATRDAEARGAPPPVQGVHVPAPAPAQDGQVWNPPVDLVEGHGNSSEVVVPEVDVETREVEDAKKVEAIAPALEEKMSAAEDEVEKVAILAEPVLMDATEDLRSMQMHAISEVEREVKVASGILSLAKLEFQRRSRDAESFAPRAKKAGEAVLAKYSARLEVVTAKLGEHKNIRLDHELALKAESEFGDLAGRLAGVEVEVERANLAVEPLGVALEVNPDEIQAEQVQAAEDALKAAQALIMTAGGLIATRLTGLKGTARGKLLELQTRMQTSQKTLDRVSKTIEECRARLVAGPLLKEAMDRVASVPDTLHSLLESEKPFLTGDERMPADEAEALLRDMDKACVSAEAKLKDVQAFLLQKVAEATSLTSEGAAKSILPELERAKKQIADGLRSVHRFQGATTKRRRACFVVAIQQKVEEADAAAARAKDLGAELREAAPAAVAEVLEKAKRAEREAQVAVRTARQELEERLKLLGPLQEGAEQNPQIQQSNNDVMRTKVKVNYLEQDLAVLQRLVREHEEKLEVERSLAEISGNTTRAEEGAEKLMGLARAWPRDRKPPAEDEKNLSNLQALIRSTMTQITYRLSMARGLEQRELQSALGRLQSAKEKLDGAQAMATELRQSLIGQIMSEVTDVVKEAEEKVAAAKSAASTVAELAVEELEPLHRQAREALEPVLAAQRELADVKAPPLTTKPGIEFSCLQSRCRSVCQQGKALAASLSERLRRLQAEAVRRAVELLRRRAAAGKGAEPGAFFTELADGKDVIGCERFGELMSAGSSTMPKEQVQLAFKKLAPYGLTRQGLAIALANYRKVVRDISFTTEFEVKSDRLRKLNQGELLEVLSDPREDVGLSLERLQCRAIEDGLRGWVTIQSNAGSAFLEPTEKPYLWCLQDAVMHESADTSSETHRTLRAGEVVELIQGPCDGPASCLWAQGAKRDGKAAGWLQVREDHKPLVEPSSEFFRCNDAVAMTDVAEVERCRMLRRVDAGEVLEVLPEPEVLSSKGGRRRKFRACSDGLEGWVTTQGNQGTSYLSVDPRHFVCKAGATVYAELGGDSQVVEVLEAGTVFVAAAEPRELPGGQRLRLYHVRTVSDHVEGWVSKAKEEPLQPWRCQYEVLQATALTREIGSEEELRKLEAKELVEVLDYPQEDGATGRLRARCAPVKCGEVGWATVAEGTGASRTLYMRPAPMALLPPPEIDEAEETDAPEVTSKAVSSGKPTGKGGGKPMGKGKFNGKAKDVVPTSAGPGGHWSPAPSVAPNIAGRPPHPTPSSVPNSEMPPPPPPAVLPPGAAVQAKGKASGKGVEPKGKGKPDSKGKGPDGKGAGFDAKGKAFDPRGKGLDSKGKGSDSKGKSFDSKGKSFDSKGKGSRGNVKGKK